MSIPHLLQCLDIRMSASIMHSEEVVDQGWLVFPKKYNESDYCKDFCYDVQFIHFCLQHFQCINQKEKGHK